MKIAHIVCSYPPYYGGMGNVVFQTASHLARLGHEVEVFTPQFYKEPEGILPEEKYEPGLEERIDYARRLKPALRYGQAAYMPQIRRELDQFDLVHLHYPLFGSANLVRKWKLKHPHRPLVITYHMDTRGPGWKGLIFKYYTKYWMPKILHSADLLITSSFDYIVSSDARAIFENQKKKWVELPFGVDIERFQPRQKPGALFSRHNLNPELPTALFVGGMDSPHYFKGIPVLLKALFLLKEKDLRLQAVLVGEGELRKSFELQAMGLGLENTVRFVGKASEEELPYYYNMADLFVLPSINKVEAFGMVLLEAMASGVPVLASDLPGVRTVVQGAGSVVQPNSPQALARALQGYFSPEGMAKDKSGIRRLAEEKYGWKPIILRLEGIYKGLVEKSGFVV